MDARYRLEPHARDRRRRATGALVAAGLLIVVAAAAALAHPLEGSFAPKVALLAFLAGLALIGRGGAPPAERRPVAGPLLLVVLAATAVLATWLQ